MGSAESRFGSAGPTVEKEWGRRRRRGARGCRGAAEGTPRGLRSSRGCEDLGSRVEAALVGSLQGFGAFTLGTTTSHRVLGPPGCCLGASPQHDAACLGGGDPCLRPPSGQGQAVHRAGRAHRSAARLAAAPLSWAPRGSPSAPSGSPPASRTGHPGPRPACWSPPPSALVRSLCA